MSAKVAVCLNVVFEDDDNQESLLYTGDTIQAPLIQPLQWTLCGTPIQFTATVGVFPDHLGIKERFQTITVMKVYSGKSTDELRLEDYQYQKKPASGGLNFLPLHVGRYCPIVNLLLITG
ncbi:uncharacterized protein LOC144639712, partial [Oculina patagonica]